MFLHRVAQYRPFNTIEKPAEMCRRLTMASRTIIVLTRSCSFALLYFVGKHIVKWANRPPTLTRRQGFHHKRIGPSDSGPCVLANMCNWAKSNIKSLQSILPSKDLVARLVRLVRKAIKLEWRHTFQSEFGSFRSTFRFFEHPR
uniref:Uncharacterized protein n=1 Tax=Parascaris univalens TaxID=6257 RepID=A0A915A1Y8_PARUN